MAPGKRLLSLSSLVVQAPIKANSITNFDRATIEQDAADTCIIVHHRFPDLVEQFLAHKRKDGYKPEKAVNSTPDNFTWRDEVKRLVEKRPLVFMGENDYTTLRDGIGPEEGMRLEWDRNGTDDQHLNKYLTLEEYLSYDEIMLGSLIGVSGPSFFINDGKRNNRGVPGEAKSFEPRGIIIGLVGTRFERDDRMDSTFILKVKNKPYQDLELTKIFQDWFGSRRKPKLEFDIDMYRARMRITVDVLLLEANRRADEAGKKAWTYVVGLGLGVWAYYEDEKQSRYYIECFVSALQD